MMAALTLLASLRLNKPLVWENNMDPIIKVAKYLKWLQQGLLFASEWVTLMTRRYDMDRLNPFNDFTFQKSQGESGSVKDGWSKTQEKLDLIAREQRLPNGYHVTYDVDSVTGEGSVNVHQDVYDPQDGLWETILHNVFEVWAQPNARSSPYDNKYPDWREQ
jgi:hypothetical protein